MNDWTITTVATPAGTTPAGEPVERFSVYAVSPDRVRVLHRHKLTAADVETFNPETEWATARSIIKTGARP
jgi:hypothetical protein